LIKGANQKFGYGMDITKFPAPMVRTILDSMIKKANDSNVEVEI